MPYKHGWQQAFLASLRERPILSMAMSDAGISSRSTVWNAQQADPEFAAAYEDAWEAGIDKLEAEAARRAVAGIEEPVIDRGRPVYRHERYVDSEGKEQWRLILGEDGQPVPLTVRRVSDAMLTLMLKGRRKKVFADRIEHTGADGGPQQVEVAESPVEVARKIGYVLAMGLRQAAEAKVIEDLG